MANASGERRIPTIESVLNEEIRYNREEFVKKKCYRLFTQMCL